MSEFLDIKNLFYKNTQGKDMSEFMFWQLTEIKLKIHVLHKEAKKHSIPPGSVLISMPCGAHAAQAMCYSFKLRE